MHQISQHHWHQILSYTPPNVISGLHADRLSSVYSLIPKAALSWQKLGLEEPGNNPKDILVPCVLMILRCMTSEITVHVYYWKFQSVFVLKYNCSIFLSPENMHIYCCRTYCTFIYTFIIFKVMASWHQGSSIRFCCINFSSVLIPQSLSLPVQRWISPPCRLSMARNLTLLVLASRQSCRLTGSSFLFRGRFTLS